MVWISDLKYHKILRTLALNFFINYWLFDSTQCFVRYPDNSKSGLKNEWRAIWSEIIRVTLKLDERTNHKSMISDQNCTSRNSVSTLSQPFWNRRIQSVPILVWPNSRFVESGTKRLLHLILYPKQKWCNIEQKWCDLKQKWGALEHGWRDLEKRWFRPKYSVIRE